MKRLRDISRDALVAFSACSESPTLIPSAVTVASYLTVEVDVDVLTNAEHMIIFHNGCDFVLKLVDTSNGWWDIYQGKTNYRVWSSGDAGGSGVVAKMERPPDIAKLVYPFTFGTWTIHDFGSSMTVENRHMATQKITLRPTGVVFHGTSKPPFSFGHVEGYPLCSSCAAGDEGNSSSDEEE